MNTKRIKATSKRDVLSFNQLSGDDFERLCYWVVEKSSEFDSVEHYGLTGDKNRDVIGYKHSAVGKREQWYFQCKKYGRIYAAVFKRELDSIKKHSDEIGDFEPDAIVFVTACSVSPSCKDSVKEYASTLSLGYVYFWTDVELDEKVKANRKVFDEFFAGGIDTEHLAKEFVEKIDLRMAMKFQQPELPSESDSVRVDEVNTEIDEAARFIRANDIEEAKSRLYVVLGKIKDGQKDYANELARTYNNLGVCFSRLKGEGGDFDKAEHYFGLALKAIPNFGKATVNLASVYLNKGGKDNYRKAYDIATRLWGESDKKEALLFEILVGALYHHKSPRDAIVCYEKSKEAELLVDCNERLLHLMGLIYLEVQDFRRAGELAESALELSPNSPANLALKARILMAGSLEESVVPSFFDVVPRFRSYQDIETAVRLLDQAMEVVKDENNPFLEEEIKSAILVCLLWLRRAKEAKYRDIRASIDIARLPSEQRQQLMMHDFVAELQARNFETAYTVLVNSLGWQKMDYSEKTRIAHIFFLQGAPQQSKDILKQSEMEAESRNDVRFWLNMSLNEVLLNNKNLAIKAVEKARDFSRGTDKEKPVLSHHNALMMRYVPSGEADRLMAGLLAYDKKYPHEKIIKAVKAIDDEGVPTEDIKSMVLERSERYQDIRQKFRLHLIPSYYLEEIFKRPYADILSFQNDPEFTIELTVSDKQFERDLSNNLETAERLVFDYAALLNLAKMNLLGHLAKFGKQLCVVRELFDKIQNELLMFEQEDLRRLWHYIRTSKEIDIVEGSRSSLKDEGISGLLDEWIVDSMRVGKANNTVFVTDDLKLLGLSRSEDIKGCNSLIILKFMLAKNWIDSKIYSTSLGDLAERFYTFLSFTGSDLFRIVMEDESKITLRSYHLVNQLFLPGSVVASFTNVFAEFIDLLWHTGSLAEDKVRWLTVITDRIVEFVDKQGEVKNKEELEKVVPGFAGIWAIGIKRSNRDEVALIEKKVDDVLNRHYLTAFKDDVVKLIKARRSSLSKGIPVTGRTDIMKRNQRKQGRL